MKKLILSLLVLMLNFTFINQASAQEVELLKSLKEVIMKGTMDGDQVVMVYGLANSWDDMKALTKNSLKKSDFTNLGDLIHTDGDSYGNYDEVDDFNDAAQRGADATVEHTKLTGKAFMNIFKRSWKSLKSIPKSYKLNFENAKDAYYNTDNVLAGAVKYTGWAVYAQLNGAYYLVVETPVVIAATIIETTYHLAATALSFPISILKQTSRVAGQVIWIGLRFVGMNIASLAAGTYSVISTTTASAITLALAGGIVIYKGTKLVLSLPSVIVKPVVSVLETEFSFDEQEEVAKKVLNYLRTQNLEYKLEDFSLNKFKSIFQLSANEQKVAQLKVKIIAKKVVLELTANRKYLRQIKKEFDVKNKEAKKIIAEKFDTLLSHTIN